MILARLPSRMAAIERLTMVTCTGGGTVHVRDGVMVGEVIACRIRRSHHVENPTC
jgi:hypothetical protein